MKKFTTDIFCMNSDDEKARLQREQEEKIKIAQIRAELNPTSNVGGYSLRTKVIFCVVAGLVGFLPGIILLLVDVVS